MTIYYLDPEDGVDANDGLTFANRKKTPSGFSSLAAGDVVRVIASREADLGNATWTDNTQTVVLATPVNANVDLCDSGWTAAANVTLTYPTATSIPYVVGTGYLNIAPATAFTTGKLCYKALGSPLDLSAFTMLSYIAQVSTSTMPAGVFFIDLCSDATGDVPIVSLSNVDIVASVNRVAQLLDNVSALPSVINSIALRITIDPGTTNIRIDNIIACKAKSSGLHLSHLSALRKNDAVNKEAYMVRAIDGANVYLGNGLNSQGTPGRTWRGTTETINTHAIVPLYQSPDVATTVNRFGNFSGISGNPIVVSGGWDRTGMTTQSGETWHCRNVSTSGMAYQLYGASLAGVLYWKFEKFGFIGYQTAALSSVNEYSSQIQLDIIGMTGCGELFNQGTSGPVTEFNITFDAITCQTATVFNPDYATTAGTGVRFLKINGRKICMSSISGGAVYSGRTGTLTWSSEDYDLFDVVISQITNCAAGLGGTTMLFSLRDCAFSLNTLNLTNTALQNGCLWLDNCTPTIGTPSSLSDRARFVQFNRNGVAGVDNYVSSTINASKNTTVHSTSAFSWQLSATGNSYPNNNNTFPVAQIACKASETVTVSAWVRYNGATGNRKYGIRARALPPAGVTEQVAFGPDVNTTWNQISVSFTPTKDCVITIDAWTETALFLIDDIEVVAV